MRPLRPRSLAGQLFTVHITLVTLVVAGCVAFAYVTDRAQATDSARHRVTATATAIAHSPSVRAATRAHHPSARLQPYAERVRRDTGVTFITIMNPRGIRWTHPEPDRIGGRFVGHIAPALRGRTFHETYTGTLGPSVRVVTPIRAEGRIVGLVSAGIAVETISAQMRRQVTALLLVGASALALGGLGTYVVDSRLRRHTHGMNATELGRVYDYHEATLHAVREGLLTLDGQLRIALINDGARELLGLTDLDLKGQRIADLGLPAPLTAALSAPEPRVDEVQLTEERVVVVNTSPVSGGERHGTVVTLRDHTALRSLAGELDAVRGFAEALRSQAHEAANRLHTVVSLIELGRTKEAVDFVTAELELAQALTDQVVAAVAEPVLAALLLAKAAQANERGVELVLTPDSRIDDGLLPADLPARDLVTVLGNLVDNAVDAAVVASEGASPTDGAGWDLDRAPDRPISEADTAGYGADPTPHREAGALALSRRPRVIVTVRAEGPAADDRAVLLLRVADTGHGIDPARADSVFRRGWSTKPSRSGDARGRGLGLALVQQTTRRHEGTVELSTAAGGGAQFTVRIPLRKTAGPPTGRRSTASAVGTV